MTKLVFGACEGAFCYLIFASNDANVRPEREVPPLLHIWGMRELRSPDKVIGNKGRTYLRQGMPGCPITPIRCRSSLRWWDVGNTYVAVSELVRAR